MAHRAALGSGLDPSRQPPHAAAARRSRPRLRRGDPVARRRSGVRAGRVPRLVERRARGPGALPGVAVNGARLKRAALSAVLRGLGLSWSCHSGSNTLQPSSRRAMLGDVARVVIIPTYDALVAEAELLAAAVAPRAHTPHDETFVSMQDAWRRTRAVWKQSEAFAIGPAETLRSAAKIDWSPVRSERIEERIAGTDELTAAYVADLGANLKGFLALEYLLFDPAGGDAAVLQALDADVRRRGMVRALAENLRDETVILRGAWVPGAGDFATELGNAGNGSSVFPTVKSAVETLVHRLIFLSQEVADAQLLAALGTRT